MADLGGEKEALGLGPWQAVVKVRTACYEDETTERARSLGWFSSGILRVPILDPLFRPY
jgi:hypothetical protein